MSVVREKIPQNVWPRTFCVNSAETILMYVVVLSVVDSKEAVSVKNGKSIRKRGNNIPPFNFFKESLHTGAAPNLFFFVGESEKNVTICHVSFRVCSARRPKLCRAGHTRHAEGPPKRRRTAGVLTLGLESVIARLEESLAPKNRVS